MGPCAYSEGDTTEHRACGGIQLAAASAGNTGSTCSTASTAKNGECLLSTFTELPFFLNLNVITEQGDLTHNNTIIINSKTPDG